MATKTAREPAAATAERYSEYRDQQASTANAKIEWIEADEARAQQVVPIGTRSKYVFRTRPGTVPSFAVRVPHVPTRARDEVHRERLEKGFARRRKEYDGEKPKFDLEKVREAVGGNHIVFKYIPGRPMPGQPDKRYRGTCYYETNNEDVYQFLMHLKNKNKDGYWSNILVEYPQQRVTINGQQFPATTAGWEAAQAALMADQISPEEPDDNGQAEAN